MLVASEADKTKSWNKYLMLLPVRPLLTASSHGKQDKTDVVPEQVNSTALFNAVLK